LKIQIIKILQEAIMPDTTETTELNDNLDSTIHLLQQDLASVDLAVALVFIERWEKQLHETDIFNDLSELKQALLNGSTAKMTKILSRLGEETLAMAASMDDASGAAQVPVGDTVEESESETVVAKIEQIGTLLSQAGADGGEPLSN
jgi:uncharacterized protein YPO0396